MELHQGFRDSTPKRRVVKEYRNRQKMCKYITIIIH